MAVNFAWDWLLNALIALLLSIVGLYGWAGVCYLFFRRSGPETEERMRRFLDEHHEFFTYGLDSPQDRNLSLAKIQKSALRGWVLTTLPFVSMSYELSLSNVLIGYAVLFFGGLCLAYSWYGLRCMKLLGLECYAKQPTSN